MNINASRYGQNIIAKHWNPTSISIHRTTFCLFVRPGCIKVAYITVSPPPFLFSVKSPKFGRRINDRKVRWGKTGVSEVGTSVCPVTDKGILCCLRFGQLWRAGLRETTLDHVFHRSLGVSDSCSIPWSSVFDFPGRVQRRLQKFALKPERLAQFIIN